MVRGRIGKKGKFRFRIRLLEVPIQTRRLFACASNQPSGLSGLLPLIARRVVTPHGSPDREDEIRNRHHAAARRRVPSPPKSECVEGGGGYDGAEQNGQQRARGGANSRNLGFHR